MGYNNSDNRGSRSGQRSFGRRDFGNSSGPRQMHRTICDSCGKDCEVPFRPSGEKPVYCSDCFEKNKDASEPRRFDDRSFRKPRFEDRDSRPPRFDNRDSKPSQNNEQFNALNAKLDKILSILAESKTQVVKEIKTSQDLPLPSKEQVVIVEKKKKSSKKVSKPSKV
jgi:CxxC-x17-CxxC domain-containing protein